MIVPENFTNVRWIFNVGGVLDPMGMSCGFQADIGATAADIAQIIYDEWTDVFVSTAASILVPWTFVGVTATKTVGGEPVVGEVTDPIVGTGSAPGLTVNTGMLIRKQTAAGGRKNRGRMYVPPFNVAEEEVEVSGQINPVSVASQTVGWNSFRVALEPADIFPWLFHSHVDDSPTPITSFVAQNLAVTQRRRMR